MYDKHLKKLVAAGQRDSAERVTELLHDRIAPPERQFSVIRLALAVLASVSFFFRVFLPSPIVQNSDYDVEAARQAVLLATVPEPEWRLDDTYATFVGEDKRMFAKLQQRRSNPRDAIHSQGLFRTIKKKQQGYEERLRRKKRVLEFWDQKCKPMNLGAGKHSRDMVRSSRRTIYSEHIALFPPEGFYAFWHDYVDDCKESGDVHVSFSTFMRWKPYYIRSDRKVNPPHPPTYTHPNPR